jgi:hypothetical protein
MSDAPRVSCPCRCLETSDPSRPAGRRTHGSRYRFSIDDQRTVGVSASRCLKRSWDLSRSGERRTHLLPAGRGATCPFREQSFVDGLPGTGGAPQAEAESRTVKAPARHRHSHPLGLLVCPVNRWIVEALVFVLVGALTYSAVTGWQAASQANCCFPLALMELPPASKAEPDFLMLTAADLNRSQPQRTGYPLKVRYVGPDVDSESSATISVNPIDRFTWAAVALGSDGRCYGTLSALDPNHPACESTYYARFPVGTPCRGNEATSQTVTLNQLPEGLS